MFFELLSAFFFFWVVALMRANILRHAEYEKDITTNIDTLVNSKLAIITELLEHLQGIDKTTTDAEKIVQELCMLVDTKVDSVYGGVGSIRSVKNFTEFNLLIMYNHSCPKTEEVIAAWAGVGVTDMLEIQNTAVTLWLDTSVGVIKELCISPANKTVYASIDIFSNQQGEFLNINYDPTRGSTVFRVCGNKQGNKEYLSGLNKNTSTTRVKRVMDI